MSTARPLCPHCLLPMSTAYASGALVCMQCGYIVRRDELPPGGFASDVTREPSFVRTSSRRDPAAPGGKLAASDVVLVLGAAFLGVAVGAIWSGLA